MKNDEENDSNKLINVEINSGYAYSLFEIRLFILLSMTNLPFSLTVLMAKLELLHLHTAL